MTDPIASYLDAHAALDRVTTRCDGLIVDVRDQYEALRRWRASIEGHEPGLTVEATLGELMAGDPPNWATIRSELRQWVAAVQRVRTSWGALSAEQRAQVAGPAVQLSDGGELEEA